MAFEQPPVRVDINPGGKVSKPWYDWFTTTAADLKSVLTNTASALASIASIISDLADTNSSLGIAQSDIDTLEESVDSIDTTLSKAFVGDNVLVLDEASGEYKIVQFQTDTDPRWEIGVDNTAESGSNAGSDFGLWAYDDAGTLIDRVATITRAAGGEISLNRSIDLAGASLVLKVNGTQVVGAQQAAITSLTDSTGVTHDDTIGDLALTNSTGGSANGDLAVVGNTVLSNQAGVLNDNFTEVHAALGRLEANDSDLTGKVQEILVAMRNHGLIAT